MTANNITELRQELLQMFDDLKNNKISIPTAAAMNNAAGRILDTAKIQIEYFKLIKEKPEFNFISDKQRTLPAKKVAYEKELDEDGKIPLLIRWQCVSCKKTFTELRKPNQCTCGSVSIIPIG